MSKINYRKDKPSENKNQCRYCKSLFASEDDRIAHEKLQFPAALWVPFSKKSYVDFDALAKHVRKYDAKNGTKLLDKLESEHTREAPCAKSITPIDALTATLQEMQRASLATQEMLDTFAAQQRDIATNCAKLHAQQQQLEKERIIVAQQYADKVLELTGQRYRLVKADDDDFPMEHAWDIREVYDFFAAHGVVFVSTTFSGTKSLVLTLFPVLHKVTYLAADIVLADIILMIVKRIRAAKHGVFNMMSLHEVAVLCIPFIGTYKGNYQASQKCPKGCEFCQSTFEFDPRKHAYANVEPSQEKENGEEHANKYRKTTCDDDDNIPIVSSSSDSQKRTRKAPNKNL